MSYQVRYADTAQTDLLECVEYLSAQQVSNETIEHWLEQLYHLLDGLHTLPRRFPVAQAESHQLGFEVRKVVFGNYVTFYRIDDHDQVVEIVGIVHGARRELT